MPRCNVSAGLQLGSGKNARLLRPELLSPPNVGQENEKSHPAHGVARTVIAWSALDKKAAGLSEWAAGLMAI